MIKIYLNQLITTICGHCSLYS